MSIAVVGAGAAGLMFAGLMSASEDVFVFDKNEKAGKKLYITGKGRCNLTNICPPDEFLKNVVRGEKFLRSAIYNFPSEDAVEFFENLGLKTKVERGNRVFPESDKSSDVIKVLKEKLCKKVNFCFNEEVLSVKKDGEKFAVKTNKKTYQFDKVVIATGGKSYSSTGSDGFGYKVAKSFGHEIVKVVPALCPIKVKKLGKLQGVSLKNVKLNAVADGKKLEFFGEMLFTDDGISGPIVLSMSSFINRAKDVKLSLDFKPALSDSQLEARLLREIDAAKNKEVKSILKNLLPKAVAEVFAKQIGIDENKQNNSLTKEERNKIIKYLKCFPLEFAGLYDIDASIVTSGGVELKQIDPKTFESKLISGLYFIGEVLDLDALTGGFNLQIAWATAQSCAKNLLKTN